MKYFLIFILAFSITSFAKDICIKEKDYDKIIKQFEENKKALQEDDEKWIQLRKEIPQVDFKTGKDNLVVEKITIKVLNDNPLEYKTQFTIVPIKEGFAPFKLRFLGGIDTDMTSFTPDVKLGLKFFGLSPLPIPVIKNIGLNALVGIKSFDASISYDLPKPLDNSAIHIYTGFSYTLKQTYGIGLSLNF